MIISEAAALAVPRGTPDELAMSLRELVSSGRLVYHTVQPNAKRQLVSVSINKEGPVALILTTARENIEEELATRLLVALTDETDKQTAAILNAAGAAAAGNGPAPPTNAELAECRALQRWLRLVGPRDVVVPFAPALAGMVSRKAMRIRRDFHAMLALVKSSALLHRAQRSVDDMGRIVAELIDYAHAIVALGEGLEELAHGDTATIDAVHVAVRAAPARQRRALLVTYRIELVGYLRGRGLVAAADRLVAVCQTDPGRARAGTIAGCIRIVTCDGTDPQVVLTDAEQLKVFTGALSKAAATDRPASVELSTSKLATLLGITRDAARTRLLNAIEAGAVIDVGATERGRPRTAPKLLALGEPTTPLRRHDRGVSSRPAGAFPSPDALLAKVREGDGGKTAQPSNQARV
jgi:hypothetical protein